MIKPSFSSILVLLFGLVIAPKLFASDANDMQLVAAAREGDVTQIEALLQQGANPNSTDARGFTPLMLAAYYGHIDVLVALKNSGTNLCAIDQKGSNAMMGAAFRGHTSVVNWMLQHSNCDINHTNYAGQTTLMMAALFGREDIIDILLNKGADSALRDAMGNSAASLATAQGQYALAEKLHL